MLLDFRDDFECLTIYMDVSFEETLRRHKTKPNRHEFGETEMKDWFVPNDLLDVADEIVIPEGYSLEQTTEDILGRCYG